MRWMLRRPTGPNGEHLADRLGQYCGFSAIGVSPGGRDPLAQLVEDILSNVTAFPFLHLSVHRIAFLRGLAFGIKERVSDAPGHALTAAADYGRWMLSIWQLLRSDGLLPKDTSAIVVFAISWIEQSDNSVAVDLKPWWKIVLPLLESIAACGGRSDCHAAFHHLGSARGVHGVSAVDLFHVITVWSQRIAMSVTSQGEDLAARDPGREEYYSWRECASRAAEIVRALHEVDAIKSAADLETAYQIVTSLAEPPFNSLKAVEVLRAIRDMN